MAQFLMPSLGADMEAGTLVEWLIEPGARVKRGDVIAVVETQKGAIEIEVFQDGRLDRRLAEPGTRVPVGAPLAVILAEGEETPSESAKAESQPGPADTSARAVPEVAFPATPAPLPPAGAHRNLRASPAARKLARERGIDVSVAQGTGPDGAVLRADVERLLQSATEEPQRRRGLDMDAMRKAIASAMARSKREIPHYYLAHSIDVGTCQDWIVQTNASRAPESRLVMNALLIKATAIAAKRFPIFNGFFEEGRVKLQPAVNVGIAIAIRGGGLIAPAIRNADEYDLDSLMERLRDLVQRARGGRLRSSEMADATITLSSLGERGVEQLYGIIYPPQVAIVGAGTVMMRPWITDSGLAARPVLTMTLAADHRVSDGHAGALFLAEMAKLLREPASL